MDVLITDVTRMRDQRICVAGIEARTGKRIRPVADRPLPSSLLVTNGGPVDFRRVLRFPTAEPCGVNPDVEDVLVSFEEAEVLGSVSPARFVEILRRTVVGLDAFGPNLVRRYQSLVSPEGEGACSLVLTRAPDGIDFFFNVDGRIRFRLTNEVDLSVTDVRSHRSDLMTPVPEAFDWMRNELAKKQEVFLCLGLTRAYRGYHWLQLNSIHFSSAPAWTLEGPPWCRPGHGVRDTAGGQIVSAALHSANMRRLAPL